MPAPRLPVGGGDLNTWGQVLNGYLAMIAELNVLDAQWAGGADPTGVADSWPALQAALSAANTAFSAVVYLPAGQYLISQTLQVGSSTVLAGAGAGITTIRAVANMGSAATQVGSQLGMPMICTLGNLAASRIRIADLTLDMNVANNAFGTLPGFTLGGSLRSSPLSLMNVTTLAIERVEVINSIGYSVFPQACTDVLISGCRVVSGQANYGYSNQDGIHVLDCTSVRIERNYVDTGNIVSVGDDAIAIQGVNTGSSDVTIFGNTIAQSIAYGIAMYLGGSTVTGVTVSGNTIHNTGAGALKLGFNNFVASSTYLITDVSIVDNVMRNVSTIGGSGVVFQDAYGGTGTNAGVPGYAGVTFAGNVLDGFGNTTGFGIYAQQGSDLTVADNTITNWAAVRGICVGDNTTVSRPVVNAQVAGNVIDMSTNAATAPMGIAVIDSPNTVVTSNTVTGPGTGVAGGTGIRIMSIGTATTGDVVEGNRVRAWATGINETNDGAAPDYNTFVGNNAHGCTAFIGILGTHDVPLSANLGTVNVVA